MKNIYSFLLILGFIFTATISLSAPAQSQNLDEYFTDNPFTNTERGVTPDAGSDDSTIGSTNISSPPILTLSPNSADFENTGDIKIFTLTNIGQMNSSAITLNASSGFSGQSSCGTLAGSESCEIRVTSTGGVYTGTLTATAVYGGLATASLSLAAPPSPARFEITPATLTWEGPAGSHDWQYFDITNIGGAVNTGQPRTGVDGWRFFQFRESGPWPFLQPGESHRVGVRPMDNLNTGYRYNGRIGLSYGGQNLINNFTATIVNQVVRACSNLPSGACIHDLGFFPGFTGFAPRQAGNCSQASYYATPRSDRWSCTHPSSSNYNPARPNGICASNSWTPIGGYATNECPQAIQNGGVHQCPRYYRCN